MVRKPCHMRCNLSCVLVEVMRQFRKYRALHNGLATTTFQAFLNKQTTVSEAGRTHYAWKISSLLAQLCGSPTDCTTFFPLQTNCLWCNANSAIAGNRRQVYQPQCNDKTRALQRQLLCKQPKPEFFHHPVRPSTNVLRSCTLSYWLQYYISEYIDIWLLQLAVTPRAPAAKASYHNGVYGMVWWRI